MLAVTKQNTETRVTLKLAYDDLMNCMRCGFCLPACPTYAVTGDEYDSPRGRIALAKAAADGLIDPKDPGFERAFDLCIGCLACQDACPSGVNYNHIFETAREVIQEHRGTGTGRRAIFRHLIPSPRRMGAVTSLVRLYEGSGLRGIVHGLGLTRLAGSLGASEEMLPRLERPSLPPIREGSVLSADARTGKTARARLEEGPDALGSARAREKAAAPGAGARGLEAASKPATALPARPVRVAVLLGCVTQSVFPDVNAKTVGLLRRAGCEVVVPAGQTCCGALHAHNGDLKTARDLARQNVLAIERTAPDFLVMNAGGCGAQIFEYPELLADDLDTDMEVRARALLARTVDVSEILLQLGTLPLGEVRARVTYQDSCHLRNVMGVSQAPRTLLRQIPGVEYVEMEEAAKCCGSGGIYNVTEHAFALEVLGRKMANADRTGADVVVTANPGCQLQMQFGVSRSEAPQRRVVHLVDLLWESVEAADRQAGATAVAVRGGTGT